MRVVNLGAGFAYLFYGEENRITVTFKLYNGKLELFYKERMSSLFSPYARSRPDMRMDCVSAPIDKNSLKRVIDAQLMDYF
jgi:hypothetical protein